MHVSNREVSALIVGLGSIGNRHFEILGDMDVSISTVSRRGIGDFVSISDALSSKKFDFIVIASETSKHISDLMELNEYKYKGRVFVEKPICSSFNEIQFFDSAYQIYVLYNLRFNSIIRELHSILSANKRKILTALFVVGQNLKSWRPERKVAENYSAYSALGGGVIRDLSHEIDLVLWLFGDAKRIKSIGGKISNLTVDSDDAWAIISEHESCNIVTVNLNYFYNPSKRFIHITTENDTLTADLLDGTLIVNGRLIKKIKFDDSYVNMWSSNLALVKNNMESSICTFNESRAVMKYIDNCEK